MDVEGCMDGRWLRLQLPVPPSVNHVYRIGRYGNQYRNPAVTAIEGERVITIRQIMRANGFHPVVPVRLEVALYWNQTKVRRDLDNILKVLLDHLSKAMGVDDSMFYDIHLRKFTSATAWVEVRIWGTDTGVIAGKTIRSPERHAMR
jgi:Holliday junction resolvase RusA-like endonuclease